MQYHGKIPCVRDGRRMLLDIYYFDAWVEKNKSELATEEALRQV
jgi:hypothetical protein